MWRYLPQAKSRLLAVTVAGLALFYAAVALGFAANIMAKPIGLIIAPLFALLAWGIWKVSRFARWVTLFWLWVLVIQARPFNWWKTVLVGSMVGCVALIMVIPPLRDFYALEFPPADVVFEASIVAVAAIVLLEVGWRLSRVVAHRRDVA